MKPIAAPKPDARRKPAPEEDGRKSDNAKREAPAQSSAELPLFLQPISQRIRSASRGGQTLAPHLQNAFNRQFGMNASGVRIHTGPEADALNRELQSRAFTTGRDIFFRSGEYRPADARGLELLAHEVVHTEQQRQGAVSPQAASDSAAISEPGDVYEQEADRAARSFVVGAPSTIGRPAAAPAVQRKCSACESGGATCPKCEEEEKLKIQRKTVSGAGLAPGSSRAPEMLPGYQSRYSAVPKAAPLLIQRDKIDNRDVDWSDFKGKVPKGAQFDAETASGIADPTLASAIPTMLTAVDTGEVCKIGKKDDKKFKVNIAIDPARINVKSFMSQEASWHKGWTTDEDARKTKCLREMSPMCEKSFDAEFAKAKKQRAKEVAACQKNFDDALAKVSKECAAQEKECRDAFKAGNTYGSATKAAECPKVVKECKDDAMSTVDYSNGDATASKRSDCSTSFGEAFEKSLKDAASWTGKMGGAETTVNTRADCRSAAFLDPCVKDLMQAGSEKLLTHEQNHFNLSQAIAAKAEEDLRAMAAAFPKEVSACGQKAAQDLAKKTLASESKALNNRLTAAKKELSAVQNQYDKETQHGKVEEKQTEWEGKIAKGFTKSNP